MNRRLLALALVGCGSNPSEPPAPSVEPAIAEPPPPRPAPGLDLAGPLVAPRPDAPTPRTAMSLDLMADRAVVEVMAPLPPRGGAVGFTFADDRPGWIARIPDSRQLPSVAYAADRIYISGGFESVSFYALSATTGRVEWATTNLEDNGPTAAVIEGDDVLFNTESCTLFSLNAKTGKRNWYKYLGDPTLAQIAVTDGIVYSAHPTNGSDGHHLSAFKTATGAQVWSRYVGSELLATPVIAGDSIYVSTLGGMTYRFDHRTGKQRWRKPLYATTAPWIVGDELFVTRRKGGKEQQVVVSVETGTIVREHRMSSGTYAHDVPATLEDWKTVWAFEGSRPVVDRGIHSVAMGSEVMASDAKTGEPIWNRRYPGTAHRRALGSVALAGSTIVVSSRDGKVFGLDVDTGYTLWSYDLGHRVVAEPIIARGWVYAATEDGYVIALNVADKSLDGWHNFGGNPQKNGLVVPPAVRTIEGAGTHTEAPATTTDLVAATQVTLDAIEADTEAARARQLELVRKKAPAITVSEECQRNPLCKPYF
jgi:outer membrane protein assembly factor BamB